MDHCRSELDSKAAFPLQTAGIHSVRQGAPESPAFFRGIRPRFRVAWTWDGETETLCGRWTTSTSQALHTRTTFACCRPGFEAAGLETGLGETSTVRSPDTSLNLGDHSIPWSEKITYGGPQRHPCSNSGPAMTKRRQKATGVFEKWSSILCNTSLDLSNSHLARIHVDMSNTSFKFLIRPTLRDSSALSLLLVAHYGPRTVCFRDICDALICS